MGWGSDGGGRASLCASVKWRDSGPAQHCEQPAAGAHGALGTGLRAVGAGELPEEGRLLLARMPPPPMRRHHCPDFPDEAVDTQRGERTCQHALLAQAVRGKSGLDPGLPEAKPFLSRRPWHPGEVGLREPLLPCLSCLPGPGSPESLARPQSHPCSPNKPRPSPN